MLVGGVAKAADKEITRRGRFHASSLGFRVRLLLLLLAIIALSLKAALGGDASNTSHSSKSVSCDASSQSCNLQIGEAKLANSAAKSAESQRSALNDIRSDISASRGAPVRRPVPDVGHTDGCRESGSGARSGRCVFGFAGNGTASAEQCAEQKQSTSSSSEREDLIELLAQLYAHTKLVQDRLALNSLLINNNKSNLTPEEVRVRQEELRAEMGADDESLLRWLRQRQLKYSSLQNTTLELLHEHPNRTIIVCEDGPKILVLPDKSDILYCYTSEQWHTKLWSDIENSLSAWHNYPIIILNVLIFLFGTTGNIFVCLSVYKNHQLRNVTNYFIVNLAFADFLVILICLPATVVWDLSLTWFFGTMPCKLIMFLQVSIFYLYLCQKFNWMGAAD